MGVIMSSNEVASKRDALVTIACDKFAATFGCSAEVAACAPGRVNLIGDHVDYCEGYVMPVALTQVTVAVGSVNNTDTCNVLSILATGEELKTSFPATTASKLKPGEPAWTNYIKGVVANFPVDVPGFDLAVMSDVPMGAGLSSSASLEVAVFDFLQALTGVNLEPVKKALLCQKAEHEFAGMPCGIMDQYIVSMGKKDHALLIDCRSLESIHIPLITKDVAVLVINSNVRHRLTGSEYPQRRAQCKEAAEKLGKTSLREASRQHLEELKRQNCDPLVIKRAKHVIEEIHRTQKVAEFFKQQDFQKAGELFYESHESLSKLMEVSCSELDELVAIARQVPGVYGARMTGGGFGGCIVVLVEKANVEELKKTILSQYKGKPDFFLCVPSGGATKISLK